MAFETSSATDLEDLIAKISTFATANGWTEDRRDNANGIFGLSKNSVFVSFRWLNSDPDILSIHQATAVLPGSGTEPGDVTGDSGNGYNSTTAHTNSLLDDERHVALGNGPFPSYHLFENDASPAYLYIVVEVSTGVFEHFGFGEMTKVGDSWTGGEFAYGQRDIANTAISTNLSSWLLDGVYAGASGDIERSAATVRMTGLPNQPAGSVWGQVWGTSAGSIPDDDAGNPKAYVQGGFRAGPLTGPWGLFSGSKTTGYVPMYSISCMYVDLVNNFVYLIGWMPDVRGVNIGSFSDKEEVTIGSDVWIMFPARQRSTVTSGTATGHMGIAYKKVTA